MGVYASLLLAMSLFRAIGLLGLPIAASRFIPKLQTDIDIYAT
jgi:O-antigen/teichoic acid export membrane protein